jgi:Sec-independent protein translocase protein TatA
VIKRVTWFVGGLATGAAGIGYAKKKIKAQAAKLAPVNVAKGVVGKARNTGRHVASALREGREAMKDKESELWAKVDDGPHDTQDRQVIVLENVREVRHPRQPRASHRQRNEGDSGR